MPEEIQSLEGTRSWRENVMISLAEIRLQLGRVVSDRESEKDTIQRIVSQSREDHRELAKSLEEHRKDDVANFASMGEKVSKTDKKVVMIVGIGIGLQTLAVIVIALLGLLKGFKI